MINRRARSIVIVAKSGTVTRIDRSRNEAATRHRNFGDAQQVGGSALHGG
jgi:hypothetical protein